MLQQTGAEMASQCISGTLPHEVGVKLELVHPIWSKINGICKRLVLEAKPVVSMAIKEGMGGYLIVSAAKQV